MSAACAGTAAPEVHMAIEGELDLAAAPLVLERVRRAAAHAPVALDLRAITFIDSSGLHVLVQAHRMAGVRVVAVSDRVRRTAELAGLTYLLAGGGRDPSAMR